MAGNFTTSWMTIRFSRILLGVGAHKLCHCIQLFKTWHCSCVWIKANSVYSFVINSIIYQRFTTFTIVLPLSTKGETN